MRAFLHAFGLCGLLGGLLAGVYDALSVTTDAAGGGAFVRLLAGATCGCSAPCTMVSPRAVACEA